MVHLCQPIHNVTFQFNQPDTFVPSVDRNSHNVSKGLKAHKD